MTEPSFLAARKAGWTQKWVQRKAVGGSWYWPTLAKERINRTLIGSLREQNQDHCSFCDQYPMQANSPSTIEHFVPKESDDGALLAFEWTNLFYCCQKCQELKGADYDPLLLKPDSDDFDFSRFFMWDFTTGELLPNPVSPATDQERARATIRIYGLNESQRPWARRLQLDRWSHLEKRGEVDHWPHRDFIEAYEA